MNDDMDGDIINRDIDTGFNGIDASLMPERTKIEIVTLDMKMAEYGLSINTYEKQRPRKERRLEELKRKLKDGRYHGGEIVFANLGFPYIGTDKKETRCLLLNGQHQCELIMRTGEPQQVTLKEFKVDKKEQLPVLYAQFDQPGGVRTAGQICHAYTDMLPWPIKAINMLSGAVAWVDSNVFSKQSTTIEERIEKLMSPEYFTHAKWTYELIWDDNGQHEYSHMVRQPVAAAILKTHMSDQAKAEEFWLGVKTGANLSPETAQLTLRNHLTTVSIGNTSGDSGDGKKKKKSSSQDLFAYCIKAFELYLTDAVVKKIHLPRKKKK
jgi:hypothetical protein